MASEEEQPQEQCADQPGDRHPGQWPKGQSGNPSGRTPNKVKAELEALRVQAKEWEAKYLAAAARVSELENGLAQEMSRDAEGGRITAARMRRVLGQDAVLDVGPVEKALRELLMKDLLRYESRMRELEDVEGGRAALEKELEELRAEVKVLRRPRGVDKGTERAKALIDRILAGAK